MTVHPVGLVRAFGVEDIEVDAPQVGIVMGSKSDMPAMEPAERELRERGIRCEVRVMSAHREPDKWPIMPATRGCAA